MSRVQTLIVEILIGRYGNRNSKWNYRYILDGYEVTNKNNEVIFTIFFLVSDHH